jgi:hypothetical protein
LPIAYHPPPLFFGGIKLSEKKFGFDVRKSLLIGDGDNSSTELFDNGDMLRRISLDKLFFFSPFGGRGSFVTEAQTKRAIGIGKKRVARARESRKYVGELLGTAAGEGAGEAEKGKKEDKKGH